MKILDKYILKQFIKNFLFGLLCFILVFILVDLFENLDKFIDKNLNAGSILQYYLYFIPEILKLITPVGMLLATLFTMSKLANYSEMTAINAAGISLSRISLPLIVFGFLITLFSIYFNGWITPKSNSAKFNFERQYLDKNKIAGLIQNLHIQDSENTILSIGSYNEPDKTGSNSSIQIFNDKDQSKLNYRFDIKTMKLDSDKNEWKLINVSKREFDSSLTENYTFKDTIYVSQIPEIKKIYLSPSQILKKQLKPDELLLSEQKELITSMEESGQNVSRTKVDYYSKISFPFANIIIILFGLSISSNKRKSGAALQFGISILIAFVYLGFIKVSQTLGYNGEINPILTAWMANILFFSIAVINIMRKNIFWK
ncbi:MAG: LptF/LptG family permease [Ignavibacteria bacterium]|nr:LptF/LptG family permease [Ignavibacteria bacterium]